MSKLKQMHIAIACAVVVVSGPRISNAADIFDTTGSSGISSALFSPPLWTASLFHTTPTDSVITSFSFQMNNTLGSMSGNVVAKIYSNSGSQPGTQVGANLGTIDMSTVTTSVGLSGLNFSLSVSSDYWLVLDNSSVTGNMFYRYTASPSGASSPYAQAQTIDSGANWGVNSGIAMIGVITAVPEPGTTILGVMGVGVLALAGYRRNG